VSNCASTLIPNTGSRDGKMGQARRAGPLARPKKGGPGWNFQSVNPL